MSDRCGTSTIPKVSRIRRSRRRSTCLWEPSSHASIAPATCCVNVCRSAPIGRDPKPPLFQTTLGDVPTVLPLLVILNLISEENHGRTLLGRTQIMGWALRSIVHLPVHADAQGRRGRFSE